MLKIKYLNEKTSYNISFKKIGSHIVQITGDFPIKEKGFICSRVENDEDSWDYSNYKTIYRKIEGGVQFSNDGSVYVAPPELEPVPEPEPYVPTLEEVKESKKQEIGWMHQTVTAEGIDVKLSTGTQHFSLGQEEMTFLMGKKIELDSGATEVAYQDSNNHCIFLSREDMQAVIMAAFSFVNVQTAYRNNLYEWIDQCETVEEIENITYGTVIPVEYQSEVYKRHLMEMDEKNNAEV